MNSSPMLDHFVKVLIEFARDVQDCRRPLELPNLNVPPALKIIRLFEHARQVTGDDFLGLASRPCPAGSYRFMSEIAVRCATLRECLLMSFRFIGIACTSVRYELVERDKEAIFEIEIDGLDGEIGTVLKQWQIIVLHRLSQWLIGAEIPLNWAELSEPMQFPFGDYAEIFGGNCSFNKPSTRLSFPRHFLERRVIRTPADVERQYSAPKGNIVEPEMISKTWKQLVKRSLRINIVEERPLSTIDALAIEFGISSQTLRRRLRDEDTSYRNLKAEVRREAALDALSAHETSLGEASLRAGFAESNGLTRALRTSTGQGSSHLRSQISAWQESKTRH